MAVDRSTSLPVMGEIAGVNMTSLGGYLHISKTRARWAKRSMMNSKAMCSTWRGMGSVRPYLAPDSPCDKKTQAIPYRNGHRPGQQGPRLPPYTRTELSSMLLVCLRRFVEETTSLYGDQAPGIPGRGSGLPACRWRVRLRGAALSPRCKDAQHLVRRGWGLCVPPQPSHRHSLHWETGVGEGGGCCCDKLV